MGDRPIRLERMDYIEKGAGIGKARECSRLGGYFFSRLRDLVVNQAGYTGYGEWKIFNREKRKLGIRWGKERIKGFSSPVETAERTNDWAWWGLFVVVVIMEILVILRILDKI